MRNGKQRRSPPKVLRRRDLAREAAILAVERDLASGKVLVDGEPVHMMTDEEARAVFGETDNDLVIYPVPRLGGRS